MAVTYEHTKDGGYRVSREFRSLSAAARGASLLESVCEAAFGPPTKPPEIREAGATSEPSALDRYLISGAVQEDANFAARVGQPETPTVEFEADPKLQALIERSDEEAPLEGLTAGKAHMAEFGANPVSQRGEE